MKLCINQGRPAFLGRGPRPLLWAGSRAARVTFIVCGLRSHLSCSVIIVLVYTYITNAAAVWTPLVQTVCHRLAS